MAVHPDYQHLLSKLSNLELKKFSLQLKIKKEQFKLSSESIVPYKKEISAIDAEIFLLSRDITKFRKNTYVVKPGFENITAH